MRYFKYKLIPFDEINKETIKNYYETIVFIFSERKRRVLKEYYKAFERNKFSNFSWLS